MSEYEIKGICLNCDWTGKIVIPKGSPIEEDKLVCPCCGCATVRETHNIVRYTLE